MNRDYGFVQKILGKEYADIVAHRYHVVRGVEAYGDLFLKDAQTFAGGGYEANDYVRIKCFELAVKEIRKRKVSGSVVGICVFRGEFAQYINAAFLDRKCYLFDTFEGFQAREALYKMP